ncbi:MAG: response regulator transcription factor [Egibacteraceae bacterium]
MIEEPVHTPLPERQPRILVVEDDPTVAEVVARYLERDGCRIEVVTDGRVALARLEAAPPDLVILDVMLPGLDGFEVCRRLREHSRIPVIMLTARAEAVERINGLELGADDYVVKPFSPRELAARVKAVLRRAQMARDGSVSGPQPYRPRTFLGMELDERSRQVRIDGQPVSLTVREFDLLAFFIRHPGEVFRREALLDRVWGYTFGDTSTVTVHVRRLREKIEPDPSAPTYVQTVWGVGYRFGE